MTQKNQDKTSELNKHWSPASNVYLLTQVGIWAAIQLMWTCGLDAPREDGQLSWLVATCVSSSDDWVRTRDLPRPNPAP